MADKHDTLHLEPRLVIKDVDAALEFYSNTLGATRLDRFVDRSGRVVHAAMRIGTSVFTMTQQVIDWGLTAPDASAESSVLLHLTVPDPDTMAKAMVRSGGEILIEIADRPYGKREGRVRDPFGHTWILSKTIETLTDAEIHKRLGE